MPKVRAGNKWIGPDTDAAEAYEIARAFLDYTHPQMVAALGGIGLRTVESWVGGSRVPPPYLSRALMQLVEERRP